MRYVKKCVATLVILGAVLGIVACTGGIVKLWGLRSQTNRVLSQITDRIDVVLESVQGRAALTKDRMQSVRDSVQRLNQRVQQRTAQWGDAPPEDAPDIDELERQLRARIQLASDWIGFMRDTAELIGQLVDTAEATSLFLRQDPRTSKDLLAAVRNGKREIDETSKLIDTVQGRLADIRAHRNIEENAARIKTLSSQIDASLVKVERYASTFEKAVAKVRVDLVNLGATIRCQISVVAVSVTVLLAWLLVAQLSLAIHGLTFVRRS